MSADSKYHLPNGTSAEALKPGESHRPTTGDSEFELRGSGACSRQVNVMPGPGQDRAWLICDDPAHGWVRQTWDTQDIDDRLPLGAEENA